MPSRPRYWGTKQGEIVKAIAVESIHDWKGLQAYSNFTERELNYHLMLLFKDNVLIKRSRQYFLVDTLDAEYKDYNSYQQRLPSYPPEIEVHKPIQTGRDESRSFMNRNILVMGIIVIFLLVSAFNPLNTPNDKVSNISDFNPPDSVGESTLTQLEVTPATSEPSESPTPEPEDTQPTPESESSSPTPESESSPPPAEPESSSPPVEEEGSQPPSEQTEPSIPSEPLPFTTIERISICTRVIDGDTIELYNGLVVRLADIDAPESGESGFASSTDALSSRVLNEKVYLDVDGTDSHGRYVCVVYVASSSRYKNVNYALWKGGYAELWDHDNEFYPDTWTMYESDIDSSHALDESQDYEPEPEVPDWAVYVGSIQSDKYHELDCRWAGEINPGNRIYFRSKSEAEGLDYSACQVCIGSSSEEEGTPSWAVYVGSTQSDKYHKLSCYWAGRVNPENRIYFRSKSHAENEGYKPCSQCLGSSSDGGSSSSGSYVGSKNSNIYHKLSCYWAKQIKPENRIYFSSKSAAESKGYRPCSVCKP